MLNELEYLASIERERDRADALHFEAIAADDRRIDDAWDGERAEWKDFSANTGWFLSASAWLDTVDLMLTESVLNECGDPMVRGARREVERMILALDDYFEEEADIA